MEQSGLLKTLDLTQLDVVMIVVWALLFVGFLKIVAAKLFAPFMALADARDAATTGALDLATHELIEAKELDAKVEDRLAQVRLAEAKKRAELINSAKQVATKTVEDAEAAAQRDLAAAKENLKAEIDRLKVQLEVDCTQMVDSILKDLKEPKKAANYN